MIVTRDVTPAECHWLAETVEKGTHVYRCRKPNYGVVKDFPATLDPDGGYPFFELPWDALTYVQVVITSGKTPEPDAAVEG